MTLKKDRPEYESLISRIVSGELNRKQASEISCEMTGLKPGSFLVWVAQPAQASRLRHVHANAGTSNVRSLLLTNPDKAKAYDAAIQKVMRGDSGKEVAEKMGISYQYLMRKAAKATLQKNMAHLKDSLDIEDNPNDPDGPLLDVVDRVSGYTSAKAKAADIDLIIGSLENPKMIRRLAALIRATH